MCPTDPSAAPDRELLQALRRGDEGAFSILVGRHQGALLRLASVFLSDRSVAEEVVQETWVALLEGLDRFAGRASLKTWLFRVLANRARTRFRRERRVDTVAEGADLLDSARFQDADGAYPGHWTSFPASWTRSAEELLLARELVEQVESTIARLPAREALVVTLRDVLEWSTQEVGEALEISPSAQRVALHRGRSKVRRAIEAYVGGKPSGR